jgi:regulator of CtrA degradation
VKLSAGEPANAETLKLLPETLAGLIARSKTLQHQVLRLDANIHSPAVPAKPSNNAVEHQLGLLKAAFEQNGA